MKFSFVLVDDDLDILNLLKINLELDGHSARAFTSSTEAQQAIETQPPDCVVTDLMMPDVDGIELIQRLRENTQLVGLKIVVLSGKVYQTDRDRALAAGADGFIAKSSADINEAIEQILDIISENVTVKFWGCRGTIPVPGPKTVKYGGNTSCVSVTFPNDHLFIFDAGTGIKALANSLMKSGKKNLTGTIFISHPHWDHINFIPFFSPFFVPGNQFTIVGSPVEELGIKDLVANQMGGVHFPITPRQFGAQVLYQDVGEGEFSFGPAQVETLLLCHPGNCLGFSVKYGDRKFCYITDNELLLEDSGAYSSNYVNRLVEFVRGADLLVTDTTYFDDEYIAKVGWGHSCVSSVCKLAHRAGVKDLYLFHHDPDQDDESLDRKLSLAQDVLLDLGSSVRARLALTEEEVDL